MGMTILTTQMMAEPARASSTARTALLWTQPLLQLLLVLLCRTCAGGLAGWLCVPAFSLQLRCLTLLQRC
jgi:hypothetical protein